MDKYTDDAVLADAVAQIEAILGLTKEEIIAQIEMMISIEQSRLIN